MDEYQKANGLTLMAMVTNDCSMLPVEDRFFVSQNYSKLTPDELVISKV